MRVSNLLVLLVACATPKPIAPLTCPPPPPAPRAAESAPDLTEAQVKERSHAFLDAFDRASITDIQDMLAPSFVWYEEERIRERDGLLANLERRAARHAPVHSRSYQEEHVFISGNAAVYIGNTTEHQPPQGDMPAADDPGTNTLAWVRNGTRWTLSLWQWDPAGLATRAAEWNQRLTDGREFNHKPNELLVAAVKGHKPGTALDIMMGQGRNAVFLATQGWRVTGVDIADQGIAMAKEEAAKLEVKLDAVQSDIAKYDLGTNKWDLIAMIYAGDDLKLVERIKPALKKGGLFVTEYFAADSEQAKNGAGGWDLETLKAAFQGWKIVRADHVEDKAEWLGQPQTKLVRFVAEKP